MIAGFVGSAWGWRSAFFLTGSLGVVMSLFIFFGVKDVSRGASEPELAEVKDLDKLKFSWKTVGGLFRRKSLVLLLIQGFFGVFPWNVITYFFFTYLAKERGYSDAETNLTMGIVIVILAAGYPLGGILGDRLFKRTPSGRAIVGAAGVGMGGILMWTTLHLPAGGHLAFGIMLGATALFIPLASPNVLSSFYDITEPDRATTNAIQSFIENVGSALAPLLRGLHRRPKLPGQLDIAHLHDRLGDLLRLLRLRRQADTPGHRRSQGQARGARAGRGRSDVPTVRTWISQTLVFVGPVTMRESAARSAS